MAPFIEQNRSRFTFVSSAKQYAGKLKISSKRKAHKVRANVAIPGVLLHRQSYSLAHARVTCHVLVCNLANNLVRSLLHHCCSYSGVVLRRSVPLYVNLAIAFDVVEASDAASGG